MSAGGERILVLGGTGLLGGAAARALVRADFEVRVMTREIASACRRVEGGVELIEGDVGDLGSLRRAMDGCFGVHISVGGPVDELGRMVSKAYRTDAALGKRLYIHGPDGIPMGEALLRYCAHFHPGGPKLSTMPIWMTKLVAALTRSSELAYAAQLMGYFDKIGEMGDPTEANAILGAPTMRLGDWMASFEGAAMRGSR